MYVLALFHKTATFSKISVHVMAFNALHQGNPTNKTEEDLITYALSSETDLY